MALDFQEIKDFIDNCSSESRVYIGCDSERSRVDGEWYAWYTLVVVVHIDGNRGCKIFGDVIKERDYERNSKKPALRLMNEVYKVMDLYHEIGQFIEDKNIEIHLDINPDDRWGSNSVVSQAVGYVKGITGVTPKIKPEAFAASKAADQFKYRVRNKVEVEC